MAGRKEKGKSVQILSAILRSCNSAISSSLCRNPDALHYEDFDHVADLDVVEPFEADAALESRLDLARIVLEPAERSDLAFVDDDVVTQQPRLRLARAGDAAFRHHTAGDGAVLRNLEGLAYLRRADPHFLERGL